MCLWHLQFYIVMCSTIFLLNLWQIRFWKRIKKSCAGLTNLLFLNIIFLVIQILFWTKTRIVMIFTAISLQWASFLVYQKLQTNHFCLGPMCGAVIDNGIWVYLFFKNFVHLAKMTQKFRTFQINLATSMHTQFSKLCFYFYWFWCHRGVQRTACISFCETHTCLRKQSLKALTHFSNMAKRKNEFLFANAIKIQPMTCSERNLIRPT